MKKNPELDPFFENARQWKSEMKKLRTIVLESGLHEEKKWYQPCYTYEGSNVAIISSFKNYCVLSFFKGSLLKDPKKILEAPGKNSQAVRLVKFTAVNAINQIESTLEAYLKEAMLIEQKGLKVDFRQKENLSLCEELTAYFKKDKTFKQAFSALTPGRQRAYNLFFTGAKQSTTRITRIEKYRRQILAGKGMHD